MTDAERQPVDVQDEEQGLYSKDYWDLVFEQLAKRKLFKLGLAVLALLYATAIYAPLVANDRPYVLEAIDLKGYWSALRMLRPVANSALGFLREGRDQELLGASSGGGAGRRGLTNLGAEREAAQQRTSLILSYLPPDAPAAGEQGPRARIAAFTRLFERGMGEAAAGEREAAEATFGEAKTLATALKKELVAHDPAQPDAGGIPLVAVRSHPLRESISPWEVFFMVLWALVMAWPLWNRALNRGVLAGDRERIRRWRKRKAAGVLAVSAAGALLWAWTVGSGGNPYDSAPFKGSITGGSMLLVKAGMSATDPDSASLPVWPPLRYGYAETHPEEKFRPPTWRREEAELDGDGRYVHGARAKAFKAGPERDYVPPPTPVEIREGERRLNDPWRRMAGTDEMGRDFFTRMLWGGRVSLSVGILSAALLTIIGVVIGSLAGYYGGRVDVVIMRAIEIIQSIPAFFLILLAMAFTDPKVVPPIIAIVVVIALIRWTGVARLVRGEFLKLRDQEFVLAARALGFSDWRTIFRHVLPNAMSPVLVSAAFAVAAGILTESAISFLGFGIAHPGASWGSLVNESKNPEFWWIQVFPGLLIFLTVTCYNLVGDAIRDALDPKMKV